MVLIYKMKSKGKYQTDQILISMKLAFKACLMFMLLSVGLSYAAYASDLAVSGWPWKISVVLAVTCCLGLLVIHFRYRGTNALWAYGLAGLVGMFSIYYFFGIFCYFYFFIFVPMAAYMKWPGLVGGILLTAYWVIATYRNATHTIRATSFADLTFEECGDEINFQIQKGMKAFEQRYKELNAFPKFFAYIIYGIAPFYLILNRILSSTAGSTGVLLFVALLGMPLSLWFIGALVRGYLVMVALPLRIEKERHKRVVVIG